MYSFINGVNAWRRTPAFARGARPRRQRCRPRRDSLVSADSGANAAWICWLRRGRAL